MANAFKICAYCDGDGKTPSKAFIAWRNVPEEFEKEFYKSYSEKVCEKCHGQGTFSYSDGEKERFNILADRWKGETINLSSIEIKHPCFIEMDKMKSKESIGWVLERMAKEVTLLMTLLHYWVDKKDSPITEDMRGKMKEMTEAWLKWGKEKGYLNE